MTTGQVLPADARVPTAIFDLDGTLLPWPSVEVRLRLALLWAWLRKPRQPEQRSRVVLRVASRLATRVFPAGRRQIEAHRNAGHRVVLLSGAPHDLVVALASTLGCDEGRGARAGVIPRGQNKATIATRWAARQGWNLASSTAYANASGDRHLLQAVGHPVVVNPAASLQRHADQHGWTMRRWQSAARDTTATRPALLHERLGLAFTAWLAVLALCGHTRIPHAWLLAGFDTAAVAAWALLLRVKAPFAGLARPWIPLALFILWFEQSGSFAHLFVPQWQDAYLIAMDRRLVGMDAALWLDRWSHPWLTEVLQFGYFSYYLLLPIVAGVLLWRRRSTAVEQLLLSSTLAYIACNLVYPVFPAEGPFHTLAAPAPGAMAGGFFTACVNWIESWGRVHGSAFPSAHVAGAVTAWLAARRWLPRLAVGMAPVILALGVATVYGRYHYVSDVLAGLLVAVVADQVACHLRAVAPIEIPVPSERHHNLGRRGTILVALLFLGGTSLRAASQTSDAFESTIQQGLRAMYDAQYPAAMRHFEKLRQMAPGHPAPDVYELLVDWWEVMSDPGNDVLAARFDYDATRALASTERWVAQHADDPEGWLYRSSAYGARGRFEVSVRPNPLQALRDGLAGHAAVRRALTLDARLPDAGLGVGAYDYFSATVPPFIRPFAWLLGIHGSRERGLLELRTTMRTGHHARTEAALLLLSAYWNDNDATRFATLAGELIRVNPHNPVLAGWQVSGDLRRRAWANAQRDIERSADALHNPAWRDFQEGRLQLARGDAAAASGCFSSVITAQPANYSLVAWAYEGRARARERLRLPATADHEAAQRLAPHALVFANQILAP